MIKTKILLFFLVSAFLTVSLGVLVPRNSFVVEDQAAGDAIHVKRLTLKKNGYVVFLRSGQIVAVSDFLPGGIYSDFNIDPFLLEENNNLGTGEVGLVLYSDNGDTFFNANLDKPVRKLDGKVFSRTIYLRGGEETDVLTEAFNKCSDHSIKPLDFGCLRKDLLEIVSAQNLGRLMNALEEIFSGQKSSIVFGTRTCHGPSHLIGEIAIDKGIPLGGIFNECSRKCDYGCLHGAFAQKMKSYEDLPERVASFCDEYSNSPIKKDIDACFHIVGHGLTEYFSKDIDSALSACEDIKDSTGKVECKRGAIMEYLMGSPDNPTEVEFSPEELLSFCGSLSPVNQQECLGYLGFYSYSLFDRETAINLCKKVPMKFALGCAYSLGSVSYFFHRDRPDEIISLCGKLGEGENECIKGAIEVYVGEKYYKDKGLNLCELASDDFKNDCKAFWCEKVKWAWGSTSSCELASPR